VCHWGSSLETIILTLLGKFEEARFDLRVDSGRDKIVPLCIPSRLLTTELRFALGDGAVTSRTGLCSYQPTRRREATIRSVLPRLARQMVASEGRYGVQEGEETAPLHSVHLGIKYYTRIGYGA
jgi:hypothetical protein